MNWCEMFSALPKLTRPSEMVPSEKLEPIAPARVEDREPDLYAAMDREERRLRAVERAARAHRGLPRPAT